MKRTLLEAISSCGISSEDFVKKTLVAIWTDVNVEFDKDRSGT
jgi:hypothetical protein